MSKPFYIDNMSVQYIINLDNFDEVINSMSTRDTSRTLRTLSLAANKRINRLMKQVKKTKDGFVPKKSAAYNIAVDSLNAITNDGKTKVKFGVKSASSRNKMIEQIYEIKKFLTMKTSTIKGAVNVRKEREKRLFGKTTEQAIRKAKTKKGKQAIASDYAAKMSKAYEIFRKYLEYEGLPNSPYIRFAGSESLLNLIGIKTLNGEEPEDVLQAAIDKADEEYKQQQETWNKITSSSTNTWKSNNV